MRTPLPLLLVLFSASLLPHAAAQVIPALPPPPISSAGSPASSVSTAPSSYDVISIHDHDPNEDGMSWRMSPDGFSTTNVTLQNLASSAYGVKMDLVSGGPSWVSSRGFDISAKILPTEDDKPVKLENHSYGPLLVALLADRFHLQAHIETKTLPIYELVVAKGGSKMKRSVPIPQQDTPEDHSKKPLGYSEFGSGYMRANSYSISSLAGTLGYIVGKTVVDKTGLTGNYDFSLDYASEDQSGHVTGAADNGADPKPDIFTALQEQLGLKLVPAKGPVRTLVIDHAELPTAN